MKLFFRTVMTALAAAIILCCGCADTGAGRTAQSENGPGAEDGKGDSPPGVGKNSAGPWQCVDTAMGTVVQQTIYAADQETAQDVSAQAMELLRELERERISWRLETSEVYRANALAGSEEGFLLSEELSGLLESCLLLWERSEGAFDVTLGTVTRLWDIDRWAGESGTEDFRIPGKAAVEQALSTCGSDRLRLVEEDSAAEPEEGNDPAESGVSGETHLRLFLPEGMQLDLGAVGKGLAMEKLITLLEERPNVSGAVISLGGSILTYGGKPDGTPWRVGIVDPFDTSESVGILTLEGQWCVSTSGDYERYVEVDGVRYHHILDPKTGAPAASDVRGVTILMKDGLVSDGLSTACYILGPEKGMTLAEEYGAEALFVMSDGKIEMSEGMKQCFMKR